MKILFTNFHHRNGGGHVTYILNLLKALQSQHEVSVATPATSRLYRYASQLPGVGVHDMRYTSRIGPLVGEVRHLKKWLHKERYDIVHVNASADHRHIMLACVGLASKPKIVWTKHNDHSLGSVGHYLRARLATDQVIAVSGYVNAILEQSVYRTIPTHLIRHGIATDYFSPVDQVTKRSLRQSLFGSTLDDTLVLGSSAGTDGDKGWLDLLRGLALLPRAEQQRFNVVVAGDPPARDKLDQVRALGLSERVLFPGLLDDVRPVLAACDAGFVLSYREALSYACRETMALGLATLVSDAGGLPENLDHQQQGWVVPVRDANAIAGILRSMLANPQRLRAMGLAARQKSEREFSLALFADRTLGVYRQALME